MAMAGLRNWTHEPHHAARNTACGLIVDGALGIACHGYVVAVPPISMANYVTAPSR
jgi:hypothetical protein